VNFKKVQAIKNHLALILKGATSMKHIVSFSGGRTSAYMVYLMEQKRINEGWDVDYIFNDTGAEHPKTYEFIKRVVKEWGINLTCLKSVASQEKGVGNTYKIISVDQIGWDLTNVKENIKKYGQFTIMNPFCTDRMKTIPVSKYIKDKYGKKYCNWLGMRIDEPRRLKHLSVQNEMFSEVKKNTQKVRYLAEISPFTKEDVIYWWSKQSFDLEIPEHLGNCIFCVKKDAKKLALAARDCPQEAQEWSNLMADTTTRVLPANNSPHGVIYRHYQSLDSIIQMFSEFDTPTLINRVAKTGGNNANSCSESCEMDLSQLDMFKEIA
jgi:3'-phosphoadenosine 5'-phosphosulfate sulfotransferase (PAPS reductase)/FAD synthetase